MIYCSLDDAFGIEYINENTQQTVIEQPKVAHYNCYDFREHLMSCSYCSNILTETRNKFYNKNDDTYNMVILFLMLLLLWYVFSKN